jgi:hypothetical protein
MAPSQQNPYPARPGRALARGLAHCVAAVMLVSFAQASRGASVDHRPRLDEARQCRAVGGDAFGRTELFFGLSRPGGVVTEEDFKNFLDARVTPRFPDGLTLLAGSGQFRSADGTILSEGAKLLILLYPRHDRDAHAKIEQIRGDYKAQFQQESVLRADEAACVSF